MLLITCPWCGDRPETEFRHAGEAHVIRPPDPAAVSDAEWTAFLYERSNPRGLYRERWRHVHGCGQFFKAVRHTLTDRFHGSYPPGGEPPA